MLAGYLSHSISHWIWADFHQRLWGVKKLQTLIPSRTNTTNFYLITKAINKYLKLQIKILQIAPIREMLISCTSFESILLSYYIRRIFRYYLSRVLFFSPYRFCLRQERKPYHVRKNDCKPGLRRPSY